MTDDSVDPAVLIADVARSYLLNPPSGNDKVIDFAGPRELADAFDAVIPIDLPIDVPARTAAELAAAAELIVSRSAKTAHPRFFNQNFAGADPVAVAGDWLGAALNTTASTFEVAPVFTLIEAAVLRKLARLAGHPVAGSTPPGMFAPGGSSATLYALQLARHRRDPDVVRVGAGTEKLSLFVAESGHYSAKKAAALLGLGTDAVVEVSADTDDAMDVAELERSIRLARKQGRSPFFVIATAGTTVTSAFDPIDAIADVCERNELWLHVDGCYGGSALFSPEHRHRLAGVERSDSFVWDLHKMMGVTQQCTALLVRDPAQLDPCFAVGADYLFQPDKLHSEYDSGDRHFQCGRRVDALKFWLTWHARGDQGFSARIEHAVAMADHLRRRIDEGDGEFAVTVAGDFTNVVFVWVPPEFRPFDASALTDEQRKALHAVAPRMKARMQIEGTALFGFQPVRGLNSFRLLFMNPNVTTADVDEVLDRLAIYGAAEWDSSQ